MHEFGITTRIVAIVTKAAHGRRIETVTLEVGALAGVMGDAITFCFDALTQETALAGVRLEIVEIPGLARCIRGDALFNAATLLAACLCGSRQLSWVSGQELNIKSLTYLEMV